MIFNCLDKDGYLQKTSVPPKGPTQVGLSEWQLRDGTKIMLSTVLLTFSIRNADFVTILFLDGESVDDLRWHHLDLDVAKETHESIKRATDHLFAQRSFAFKSADNFRLSLGAFRKGLPK